MIIPWGGKCIYHVSIELFHILVSFLEHLSQVIGSAKSLISELRKHDPLIVGYKD
jgi:hypothetical protein